MLLLQKIESIFEKKALLKELKKFSSVGHNVSIGSNWYFHNPQNISIGNNFYAGKSLKLSTWPNYRGEESPFTPRLSIGDNVSVMDFTHISCMHEVIIENGCLFGEYVFVTDNNHGDGQTEVNFPPIKRKLHSKGTVHIGKNVWIGRNACIMPNVTVGEGAIIGANSVVTHDVPAFCVVGGVPARIIKEMPHE